MFKFTEFLKGIVTQVNSTLCSFTIRSDNLRVSTIHAALVDLYLPNVGEDVRIFNLYRDLKSNEDTQYYLKTDADFYSNATEFGVITSDIDFAKLVSCCGWGIEELRDFFSNSNQVKFEGICRENNDEVKVQILKYLLTLERDCTDVLLSMPSLCHFVKYEYEYPKFPHFSQGYHHSRYNELIFGLFLSNKHCLLELSDGKSGVYLKVKTNCNLELLPFLNRIVCISKFTIITEVYRGGINFQYLLCDVADVKALDFHVKPEKCVPHFLHRHIFPGSTYKETFQIYILNIAQPNSTINRRMDCWIEVKMKREEKWLDACLCFQESLFSTLPLLDVGKMYTMYLKDKLIFYTDPEIKRVAKSQLTYRVQNCVFVNVPNIGFISFPDDKVLSLKELRSAMQQFNGRKCYVNFEAVISLKMFCPADQSSRTKRQIDSSMFGTPGNKTHILRFEDIVGDLKVSLYLNNWERKQCPLGQVPQVRVIVRHVELTKNYLRSSALTNFQVIRYENPIIFNTANLNPDNPQIFYNHLGNGHLIPFGTLVRSRPTTIQVRSFSLAYKGDELHLKSTFFTRDERGEAFVICTSVDLIKKAFLRDEEVFNKWLDVFKLIGTFSIYEEDTPTLLPEHEFFYKCLLMTVKAFFNKGIISLDWLCRRIEPKQLNDNKGLPLWFACEIISIN